VTRKRLITSWSVTLGVAAEVVLVKRLPRVWRCIMDAGVVVGLTYGILSILYSFVKSIVTGQTPGIDACLPEVELRNSKLARIATVSLWQAGMLYILLDEYFAYVDSGLA
jgi:hypothetical protein